MNVFAENAHAALKRLSDIKEMEPSAWTPRTEKEIEEAWNNLDLFPGPIADRIASLKMESFNFRNYVTVASAILQNEQVFTDAPIDFADAMKKIAEFAVKAADEAYEAHELVTAEIDKLS